VGVRADLRRARKRLDAARTFAQWHETACEVDRLSGAEAWREDDESDAYHADLLRQQRNAMRRLRTEGKVRELTRLLTHSLYRNLSDIQSPSLYETALAGTKRLVSSYLAECELALDFLADSDAMSTEEKVRRFKQARRVFGRSALMLSGGATLGFYHLGVIKALFGQGSLPQVLCGSSTGALIGAVVCTRNDDELQELFDDPDSVRIDGMARVGLRRWLRDGTLLKSEHLYEVLRDNVGEVTFNEAQLHSGRKLCISVSPTRVRQKPRLLTPLTAPDVLVTSAALASSALPGLFPPVVLEMRGPDGHIVPYIETEKWVDGSLHGDLPKLRLTRLHNINHFIVSQTNPHVLPIAQLRGGTKGARPKITGVASAVARTQGSGVADVGRRLGGDSTLGLVSDQLHTLFSQDYRGDINIHPRFKPHIYRKVFSNPSRADLDFFILEGERATWPRVAMIHEHTRISRAFDRCLARIRGNNR